MKIIINENQLKQLSKNISKENILLEEIKNRQIINRLFETWKNNEPNLTIEDTEKIVTDFNRIKSNLNPNQAQVYSFLSRYDGNDGYAKFEVNDLKDITKYSFFQIDFLLEQYNDVDQEDDDNDDIGNMSNPTEKIYENSEKLWKSDKFLIINDGRFRVYDIPNQITSIKFGYYVKKINNLQKATRPPWCVTWPTGANMWGTYRQMDLSFYFVIDESKNPETDKYYLSALQKDNKQNSITGYYLTSVINDGDTALTWDNIVDIYPKLSEHKDLIIPKEFNDNEIKLKNIVGQISENQGSRYEFKRQSRILKKRFIELNNPLHKPESWMSLDTKLKDLYILSTTRDNAKNKFDNYNFLSEIRKSKPHFKLLNKRLTDLGFKNGVGYLLEDMLKNRFNVIKTEANNKLINILQQKNTREFGIFDYLKGDWLEKDNIRYEPFYNNRDTKLYRHNEDDKIVRYVVEEYTKNKVVNDETFYSIYINNPNNTHFMSRKSFLKLLSDNPDINIENVNEPMIDPNNRTFQNKPESDIKEFKRGY
jgi:hypothetical protein